MIDFPCQCGHRFSVPEELAGGMLQCPQCHRLNDVPLLSELKSFTPEGTYVVQPPPPRVSHAGEVAKFLSRQTVTPAGEEKDLRRHAEEFGGLGAPPPNRAAAQPKYDPITGKLIEPMAVAPAAVKPITPTAALLRRERKGGPAIAYASGD